MKIQAKNVEWLSSYSIFLSKFHSNCQLANRLDWQKQVKFQIDITFEVVKILSLIFQDFLKSLNSVREPILKKFEDGEV